MESEKKKHNACRFMNPSFTVFPSVGQMWRAGFGNGPQNVPKNGPHTCTQRRKVHQKKKEYVHIHNSLQYPIGESHRRIAVLRIITSVPRPALFACPPGLSLSHCHCHCYCFTLSTYHVRALLSPCLQLTEESELQPPLIAGRRQGPYDSSSSSRGFMLRSAMMFNFFARTQRL